VVDDEPIIVKRLTGLLERLGFRVTAFTDSDLALTELARRRFEFVITDLKMRKNDGLRILRSARRHDRECQMIVITGLGNGQHVGEALKAGAAECLNKPFRIEELKKTLDRLRSHRELTRLVA
jgi:DNA-binding NtrC family response regulator